MYNHKELLKNIFQSNQIQTLSSESIDNTSTCFEYSNFYSYSNLTTILPTFR